MMMVSVKEDKSGGGKFYRVVVLDKDEFMEFRNHDVGKRGGVERVAGKRRDGSWDTQAWLIAKDEARIVRGMLVGKNEKVMDVLRKLGGEIRFVDKDVFEVA